MNVIIEISNEKNKIKDSNTRDMNVNIVNNDFIIDYLNFDITIWNMNIRYENEFTDLLNTKILVLNAKTVTENVFIVLYDVYILMLDSNMLI